MQDNDFELLQRVRHGDETAFHALVDRYADHLYGVAVLLVGNRADAEDVVQETLAGAYVGLASFRQEASVKTWLLRILMRQAARLRRSRNVRRAFSLWRSSDQPQPIEDDALAEASGTAAVDARLDVKEMLSQLSPEQAEVIILRELEGLSYEEMARALHVPRGTVESRLHRARQELKRRFAGDSADGRARRGGETRE